VKPIHRLDYTRLAEVLAERGLCDPAALREALKLSGHGNPSFPETLVNANLVGDWELCRVVCEIYNLAFLPLDLCVPDPQALEGIDLAYLCQYALVPLGRFGNVLTVAMPGMVSADVLGRIPVKDQNLVVVPLVGSIQGNRRWIELNLESKLHAQLKTIRGGAAEQDPEAWGSLFDEGDAAVFDVLNPGTESLPQQPAQPQLHPPHQQQRQPPQSPPQRPNSIPLR
jgi:hypothetical protein